MWLTAYSRVTAFSAKEASVEYLKSLYGTEVRVYILGIDTSRVVSHSGKLVSVDDIGMLVEIGLIRRYFPWANVHQVEIHTHK